ncbi:hypothetical protein EDB85DRAFT_1900241 [Lactarius pseudohatsudake]|nr:hypothetical protein EDB85DRAFT_1900241 [Lactarius pseudohatsudake]
MNSSVTRLPQTSARMTSAGRPPQTSARMTAAGRPPQTSARMTSAGRQPRSFPSPQHDDVSDGDVSDDDLDDMDLEWSYDKCTTLILHDADDCTFCNQWKRHYFTHVRGSCRTLQEAREARLEDLNGRGEWRQELSALRNNVQLLQGTLTQDLAALHSEIQQLQGAVASLVASQRDDAQTPRRRKLVHPPRTPSPQLQVVHSTRTSTPSVVAISPGPSYDIPRDI